MEQLIITIASVHAINANCFMDSSHISDISYNITSFLSSLKWPFNTSINADLHLVRIKGSNKTEEISSDATTDFNNNTTANHYEVQHAESSIMWYLASFGALVMFFLLISFSEVCCKKSIVIPEENEPEVSPPPYDLFAPPTYDSLYSEKKEKSHKTKKKKKKCEIFIIPMLSRNKISARLTSTESQQTLNTNIDQAANSLTS